MTFPTLEQLDFLAQVEREVAKGTRAPDDLWGELQPDIAAFLAAARIGVLVEAFLREHGLTVAAALAGHCDPMNYPTGEAPQEALESLLREVKK